MTRTLLIAYDLASDSPARGRLTETIMALGEAWARPLDAVWMLRTSLAPETVERRLAPILDEHDGLVVQEARGEAAFANTGLRWFRPRRSLAMEALETAAVLAFPGNDRGIDRAA